MPPYCSPSTADRIDLLRITRIPMVTVYRRWTEVLGFLDQNHGTRPLAGPSKPVAT